MGDPPGQGAQPPGVREQVASPGRVAGEQGPSPDQGAEVAARVDWVPDASIARIVGAWPAGMNARRAARLGLHADASYDDIIRAYLRENPVPPAAAAQP